jgi:hypothetical protein
MQPRIDRRRFLIGVGTAGPLTLALPSAYAADSPDYYGAVAFSQQTGSTAYGFGYTSRAAAEQAALQVCRGRDARVAVWAKNAWIALVVGARRGYGYAYGANAGAAIDDAYRSGAGVDGGLYLAALIHCSPLAPIFYDHSAIPDDWGRREIISTAMNLVHNRFRDLIVARNMYGVIRGGAYVAGGVMAQHGMGEDEVSLNALLWHQLANLRMAGASFPRVVFKTADHDPQAWAWGRYGLVTVRDLSHVTGEFEVQVSLRYLGGGGSQSDPINWASIIAHEMLHNLGHMHERDNYTDDRQINVFTHAVYHNGTYKRGLACPGFV